MRLFIAIELPEELLKRIKKVQESLYNCRSKVSWMRLDRMHLTLKFLGDVKEEMSKDILRVLSGVVAPHQSFTLEAAGLGCFPDLKKPRVIWVGIHEDSEGSLSTIYNTLEESLLSIGFNREERRFHPHLTLGRIKEVFNEEWKERIPLLKDQTFGQFKVESICLFSSVLKPTGTVYIKLGEAKLKMN